MISTIVDGWKVRTFLKGDEYQTEIYGTSDGKHTVLQYSQPTLSIRVAHLNSTMELKLLGLRHIDVCKNIRQLIGFE